MRIQEAITRVDGLNGGAYPDEELVRWLSDCEAQLNSTAHAGLDLPEIPLPYDMTRDMQRELGVKAPFDGLYLDYLEAQLHYHNGDVARYNNAVTRFNARVTAYGDLLHRTRRVHRQSHITGVE